MKKLNHDKCSKDNLAASFANMESGCSFSLQTGCALVTKTLTASARIEQAKCIKASLECLHDEAAGANMNLLALLIGAEAEAADDVIKHRHPALLRLIKSTQQD